MWQGLKAVTTLFTLCPGLQRKKIEFFLCEEKKIHFSPLSFSQGEKNSICFFFFGFSKGEKRMF